MRLNRFLSQAGIASRRKADELIERGRVQVNGNIVTAMGVDVSADDEVMVDGKRISLPNIYTYVAMNKPEGYVTTMADWHAGEKSVVELLPAYLPKSLRPVGRLDKESTGLLLFTDDGDLAHRLTHPSFEHEKEYVVTTVEAIHDNELQQLENGVQLEEGVTAPAVVKRINPRQFRIILRQGWKRQIRRMVAEVGHRVERLHRVRIGNFEIGRLQSGEVINIRKEEIVHSAASKDL